jgi:hypothetical protein
MLVAAKTVWIGGSKIEHAMTKPIRIQRQRIKGRAGRCHPTLSMAATRQIGDPWKVGVKVADPIANFFGDDHPSWFGRKAGDVVRDAADAVGMYRLWLHDCARRGAPFPFETLRGKNLACWCPLDLPCHADVLLELANKTKELRKT